MEQSTFAVLLLTASFITHSVEGFGIGSTLYCYECISTQPGCQPFNWWWHWSKACPEEDDTCVKIIERKGGNEVVTRECLSSLRAVRTDIPADHYEGCRAAAHDVKLAHYVNNSIKQLDIKRDYYDEVTWCFCYFDNRCNSATTTTISLFSLLVALVFAARALIV